MLHQDCMSYLATCADGSFDLAIVDVQYGIGEDGRKSASRHGRPVRQPDGSKRYRGNSPHAAMAWDDAPPPQAYFDELFRVAKRHIIFGENYLTFTQKDTSSGRIIWDKVNFETDFSDCELLWTNCIRSVRQIEYMWNGMMQGKSLKEGRAQQGDKRLNQQRIHPTEKPIVLYKKLLTDYAHPGARVLDTHGGSGSICIAAFDLGIDLTWMEDKKPYFESAAARFRAHVRANQNPLFGTPYSILEGDGMLKVRAAA